MYSMPAIVCPNDFVRFLFINSKRKIPHRAIKPKAILVHLLKTVLLCFLAVKLSERPRRIRIFPSENFLDHTICFFDSVIIEYRITCLCIFLIVKLFRYSLYPKVQYVGQGYQYFHAQINVRNFENLSNGPTATLLLHEFIHSFCVACIY